MIIASPHGRELAEWAHEVTRSLGVYADIPDISNDDWQQWGMGFFNTPQLDAVNPPNPYQFTDWVEWGDQLAMAMNTIGSPGPFIQARDFSILQTRDGALILARTS